MTSSLMICHSYRLIFLAIVLPIINFSPIVRGLMFFHQCWNLKRVDGMSGLNDDLTGRERTEWAVMPLLLNAAIPVRVRYIIGFGLLVADS